MQLSTTSTGATDVQGTFLNAIDTLSKMQDPAAKAAAATKLFGKNWQEASELIAGGAGKAKARLDSLAGTKLVDDKEIAKAQQIRDQFDAMHDSLDELSNMIGEQFAPALGQAAEEAAKLGNVAGPALSGLLKASSGQAKVMTGIAEGAGHMFGNLIDGFKRTNERLLGHKVATDDASDSLRKLVDAQGAGYAAATTSAQGFDDATDSLDAMAQSESYAAYGADRFKESLQKMRGQLDFKHETDQLIAQIGGAMLTVGSGAQVASDDVYGIQKSIIDVGEYAGANPIEIQSVIDEAKRGEWDKVARTVQGWANANPVTIKFRIDQNIPKSPYSLTGSMGTAAAATSSAVALLPATSAAPVVTVPVSPGRVSITVNAGMVTDTANPCSLSHPRRTPNLAPTRCQVAGGGRRVTLSALALTSRWRPIVEIGTGDTRTPVGVGVWGASLWCDPGARWNGSVPLWLVVSCYVHEITTDTGRDVSVDRFTPGTCHVTADNTDGWATDLTDPATAVRAGRQLRVSIGDNVTGARTPLWRGFIDARTPTFTGSDPDRVTFAAVDALAELGLYTPPAPAPAPVGAGESGDARFVRMIAAAGWPTAWVGGGRPVTGHDGRTPVRPGVGRRTGDTRRLWRAARSPPTRPGGSWSGPATG